MVRWRVGLQWYAVALLLPVAIVLVALYLVALFGGPSPTAAAFAGWYTLPLILLSTTLINGPFTEEPGWRGFLLPRLQSSYSPLVASLIVGVIWASWHLPLLLSDLTGQRPPVQFFGWRSRWWSRGSTTEPEGACCWLSSCTAPLTRSLVS